MTVERSRYDRWYGIFSEAYEDPSSVSSLHCPNCGAQSLHLVFRGDHSDDVRAIAIFWCGSCMYGLAPNTTPVPAGTEVTVSDTVIAPDFRIVKRDVS